MCTYTTTPCPPNLQRNWLFFYQHLPPQVSSRFNLSTVLFSLTFCWSPHSRGPSNKPLPNSLTPKSHCFPGLSSFSRPAVDVSAWVPPAYTLTWGYSRLGYVESRLMIFVFHVVPRNSLYWSHIFKKTLLGQSNGSLVEHWRTSKYWSEVNAPRIGVNSFLCHADVAKPKQCM